MFQGAVGHARSAHGLRPTKKTTESGNHSGAAPHFIRGQHHTHSGAPETERGKQRIAEGFRCLASGKKKAEDLTTELGQQRGEQVAVDGHYT